MACCPRLRRFAHRNKSEPSPHEGRWIPRNMWPTIRQRARTRFTGHAIRKAASVALIESRHTRPFLAGLDSGGRNRFSRCAFKKKKLGRCTSSTTRKRPQIRFGNRPSVHPHLARLGQRSSTRWRALWSATGFYGHKGGKSTAKSFVCFSERGIPFPHEPVEGQTDGRICSTSRATFSGWVEKRGKLR